MATKFSGMSYKPGIITTRNSQELWQICFDDEDLRGDLGDYETMSQQPGSSSRWAAESGSEGGARSNDAADRRRTKYDETDEIELINNAAANEPKKSKPKSNRQAYQMSIRPIETEIRATPTGSNGNGCTYSTMTVGTDAFSNNANKPDETSPIHSGQPPRILIRRDSDLELLLPPQSDRVGALRKKARDCCSDCSRWATWRKVVCVAILVITAILLYVIIMVAIVKGIGAYKGCNMPEQISVEGNGHCCHTPSSKRNPPLAAFSMSRGCRSCMAPESGYYSEYFQKIQGFAHR